MNFSRRRKIWELNWYGTTTVSYTHLLVKACEEEFGVSAAAGVVVAAAGDGAGAAAEEKDEFDVELVSAGSSKEMCIRDRFYVSLPFLCSFRCCGW